jgi:hypothetical protein
MSESEEFHRDAGAALYLVGLLSAKLQLGCHPSIRDKALAIENRVELMIAEARAGQAAQTEVKRLRHDIDSLRTTNEALAERMARAAT